ncbi:MAG: dihydrofolate reductase family protein [Thermoplasmata archaeon]|nr:dihydrofolate reductase family protein [Thermoplasmata archaeon]
MSGPPEPVPSDRPRVWVNCAVSMDGRLAFAHGVRASLSGPEDLVRVHRLRAGSDAILVGVGTVVQDDPSLRLKPELLDELPKRPPRRVVVDASGRTPVSARILDSSAPTIVATTENNARTYPDHVHVLRAGRDQVDLRLLFRLLRDLGVAQLMVEGGSRILASVARERLFDRWTIYYAPVLVGGTTAPSMVRGPESIGPTDLVRLKLESVAPLGEGFLATLRP